jgi:hypothetical protein
LDAVDSCANQAFAVMGGLFQAQVGTTAKPAFARRIP